jgi:hypothetical protein
MLNAAYRQNLLSIFKAAFGTILMQSRLENCVLNGRPEIFGICLT